MTMTGIKICGLTRAEDALLARDLGADFLGFIFVPSTPRYIEPEAAAEIAAALRSSMSEKRAQIVGVFRDASTEYVRQIADLVGLDLVQLHGAEPDEQIVEIQLPVIKTFRVGDELPDTSGSPHASWVLFDTYDERRSGGTGRRFDWTLLAGYPRLKPFLLAGGLTPDNVAAAISAVRPDAIDVSSGIESEEGVKDPERMRQLFERVKGAA